MGVSVGQDRPDLRRVLGLWDSVAIIVGVIVGSGIFFAPTAVAQYLPHTGTILCVWLLAGLTALSGALTYAELGARWPHTGGMYVFIRECFGPLPSFIYGWGQLLIARPASVAAISVVCAQYVAFFVPVPTFGIKLLAVTAILIVSIINYLGVRLTSVVQNFLTSIKVLALMLIAVAALVFYRNIGGGTAAEVFPNTLQLSFWSAFGLALVVAFWASDGWSEITNVAGEIRDPARTIPLALLIGTVLIVVLYMLVNGAYLHVLGVSGVQASDRVAADTMIRVLGPLGGSLISIAVVISTLGSLNGTTLTGPRIYFAMAVDGLFFPWAKKVDPKYRSPSIAIALQALLAVPLVITWRFEQLATFFVFVSLIFYALVASAVFRLRRMPGVPAAGGYKTWGYPVTPVFFLLVAAGILINTAVRAPLQAIMTFAILLSGVPVFFLWKGRRKESLISSDRTDA
ncbi:MAG: amino acid permease [Pseudomonadota bacterium]